MSRYFEKGREPVSSYTHFWGALASALGTLALAARCAHTGAGGAVLAGVVLFGLSLVALYSASSIYHYALGAAAKLRRLRKLDHAMIYVLIAGSYTPLCIKFMDSAKLPVPYFWCRIFTDGVCVVLAFLLGGLIGLGTLVCALALGPFVAFFTRYAAEAMVFGRAAARASREATP